MQMSAGRLKFALSAEGVEPVVLILRQKDMRTTRPAWH